MPSHRMHTASEQHPRSCLRRPNDDGWGYTKSYATGWDRIFAKKDEPPPAAAAQPASAAPILDERMAALDAAKACGALSDALYEQAKRELK